MNNTCLSTHLSWVTTLQYPILSISQDRLSRRSENWEEDYPLRRRPDDNYFCQLYLYLRQPTSANICNMHPQHMSGSPADKHRESAESYTSPGITEAMASTVRADVIYGKLRSSYRIDHLGKALKSFQNSLRRNLCGIPPCSTPWRNGASHAEGLPISVFRGLIQSNNDSFANLHRRILSSAL